MPQGQTPDYAALAKQFGGAPMASHEPTPKAKPSTDAAMLTSAIQSSVPMGAFGGDFGSGIVKSGGRVVVNIADLVNWLASKPFGAADWQNTLDRKFDTARGALASSSTGESVGDTVGSMTMAMAAGGPATSLARGAASMAPRVLAIPVRAAVDALTSAGIAKAEGQDATLPAVTGGLMGGAMGVLDDAAKAARLARGIENRQVSALAPPGRGTAARKAQEQIRQVGPQLAREPGMGGWSRGTVLTKVTDAMDEATDAMDTAAAAVAQKKPYAIKPIVYQIQDLRNNITAYGSKFQNVVPGPEFKARDAALAAMIDELQALGPTATYEQLKKVRQGWQQAGAAAGAYTRDAANAAAKATGKAASDGASMIVETLAKGEPAMQAANSRWSFLKKAKDAMELAEQVEQSSPRALRGVIARTGGAMAGGGATGTLTGTALGAIIGNAVEKAMTGGPTTQITTARLLAKFEDAIKAGKWADVEAALTSLRLAGQAAISPAASHGGGQ